MTNLKAKILLYIAIALLLLSSLFPLSAFAIEETDGATVDTTSVLDDLGKDETFNISNYPAKEISSEESPFDVFQVAETDNDKLFVYVYQPLEGEYAANEIRLSSSIGENVAPRDYGLTLLSRNGTLAKYTVDDFELKTDTVRYYYVIQIARPWNKDIDETPDGDNTASTVPYAVGKIFTACTIDGNVTYTETHEEVISITAKYCGFVRNFVGWAGVGVADVDSHFIAFDTDRPIDKLIDADVTYTSYSYTISVHRIFGTVNERYRSEEKTNTVTVKADEHHSVSAIGWVGNEYSWTEIESAEQFLLHEEISDEMKDNVSDKSWVLRFVATPHVRAELLETYEETATSVTDASILRLKFETNGVVYNLGVVDNKQSGSGKPINDYTSVLDIILARLGMLLGAVLLVACLLFIPGVLNLVITVLKLIGWVLLLPFRLLARLFKAIFKRNKG